MPYEQSIDYEDRARQRIERGCLTILGVTDEVSTCDCCGRSDLKRAVALEDGNGEVVYYGTTCAALATGRDSKDVRKESKKAQDKRDEARRVAEQKQRDADFADWQSFLQKAVSMPGKSVCDILPAIGSAALNALHRQWRMLRGGR